MNPGGSPLRKGLWRYVIHRADNQIGKCYGDRRISRRAGEDSHRTGRQVVVGDAELETVIQEETQFWPGGPDPNANLPGRAGRGITAEDGLMQVMALPDADALGVCLSVAGQGKAIVGHGIGTYKKTVLVFTPAQAGAGGDLGIEIACNDIVLQAGQVDTGLHG